MKKTRSFRLLTLVLAVLTLTATFALPASAASESALSWNLSYSPVKGNLSRYDMPAHVNSPKQGETAYINFAATTDFYFDRAEFYVMAPGASSYTKIYTYDPSGYFRWCYCGYTFAQSGTYYLRLELTDTAGAQYSGEASITVQAKKTSSPTPSQPSSSGRTYTYNGVTYNVVPNFNTKYCYNQNNYSRFVNASGKNRGCTATAMCTAYSIYHNTTLSPNSVKWSRLGTSWEYCNRYSEGNKVYAGYTFTQKQALKAAYNCVTNSKKPIIIGVKGSDTSQHVVTVVGIRQGANVNNLSMRDFLIVDPWGGTVEPLSTYTSVDCSWALRIPKN